MILLPLLMIQAAAAGPVPRAPAEKPELKACAEVDPGSPFLSFERQLVRQGDVVRIRPMVSHAWFGDEEVRWDCYRGWKVSDPRLGRIDAKKGVLILARDAPPGSDITVSADFGKTRIVDAASVRASLRIVAREAQVLTGTWSEYLPARRNCDGDTIAELIFGPRGGYSFTFSQMMIETMTSGGGGYSWDPATEVLTMNGQTGRAVLQGRVLGISGIDFYPRAPPPPVDGKPPEPMPKCIMVFHRTD